MLDPNPSHYKVPCKNIFVTGRFGLGPEEVLALSKTANDSVRIYPFLIEN